MHKKKKSLDSFMSLEQINKCLTLPLDAFPHMNILFKTLRFFDSNINRFLSHCLYLSPNRTHGTIKLSDYLLKYSIVRNISLVTNIVKNRITKLNMRLYHEIRGPWLQDARRTCPSPMQKFATGAHLLIWRRR